MRIYEHEHIKNNQNSIHREILQTIFDTLFFDGKLFGMLTSDSEVFDLYRHLKSHPKTKDNFGLVSRLPRFQQFFILRNIISMDGSKVWNRVEIVVHR